MEWVSVKDSEPPNEGSVLVYGPEVGIHVAKFHRSDHLYGVVGGWECCCYCGGESKVCYREEENYAQWITHWAKLPEQPVANKS